MSERTWEQEQDDWLRTHNASIRYVNTAGSRLIGFCVEWDEDPDYPRRYVTGFDTIEGALNSAMNQSAMTKIRRKGEREAAERATHAEPLRYDLHIRDVNGHEIGVMPFVPTPEQRRRAMDALTPKEGAFVDWVKENVDPKVEQAPASRSPVADLLKTWEGDPPLAWQCLRDFRAALTAQAALWRRDAEIPDWEQGAINNALRRCAADLLGESK